MKVKNKHLTLEDRKLIERGLNFDKSAKEIASWIGKDPTTVSKEAKLNQSLKFKNQKLLSRKMKIYISKLIEEIWLNTSKKYDSRKIKVILE